MTSIQWFQMIVWLNLKTHTHNYNTNILYEAPIENCIMETFLWISEHLVVTVHFCWQFVKQKQWFYVVSHVKIFVYSSCINIKETIKLMLAAYKYSSNDILISHIYNNVQFSTFNNKNKWWHCWNCWFPFIFEEWYVK